jgi:hypothetical protein
MTHDGFRAPGTYAFFDVGGQGFNVRFTVPAGLDLEGPVPQQGGCRSHSSRSRLRMPVFRPIFRAAPARFAGSPLSRNFASAPGPATLNLSVSEGPLAPAAAVAKAKEDAAGIREAPEHTSPPSLTGRYPPPTLG